MRFRTVFIILSLILVVAGSTSAQSDPYGTIDVVYVDSVEASPGQDISVQVSMRNDEQLNSISIPITYDPGQLSLKSISFEGSRVDYLQTKIINPDVISDIDGHFVVAAIQILEAPIPVGDGPVFTMLFTVSDTVSVGQVALIDTLFYPPGGKMMLVDEENAIGILPLFVAGKVLIGNVNRAPQFSPQVKQYVLEGDSLKLDVGAADPDGDPLSLAVTNKPSGAVFVNNGDGTGRLTWVPAYIGPSSADGSPFTASFWASDGDIAVEQQVPIEVINANRAPKIIAPTQVSVDAGKMLTLQVLAQDPDFESVSWSWQSGLNGATFDAENPGTFLWQSLLTDTGHAAISFVATDPHGFSDTVNIGVTVNPAAIYTLALDTVEIFPGDEFYYDVLLDNMVPVEGFNLLFKLDPSVFNVLNVTKVGTRAESFEYFTYVLGENSSPGDIRIVGTVDLEGVGALAAGVGPVARLQVRASSDLGLSGLTIPATFRFLDTPANNDNTLTDTTGSRVDQQDIQYSDGWVKFADIGDVKIGDINLNGLAAEISDVIYFTNFFIDPHRYPFNILQYANSDVNRDGLVATIADLVALINKVIGGSSAKPIGPEEEPSATYEMDHTVSKFSFEATANIAAVYVRLISDDDLSKITVSSLEDNLDLTYSVQDDGLRVLAYSLSGKVLPVGTVDLFAVEGIDNYEIAEVEMASADGRIVTVAMSSTEKRLPDKFALHQNYPNPFNPQTEISFDLVTTTQARLRVYNVLGRVVRTLADGVYSAGTYSVTWDGTDDAGRSVSSGVYLYRLEAGGESVSRKMMLLK